jgi:hypothetical protein
LHTSTILVHLQSWAVLTGVLKQSNPKAGAEASASLWRCVQHGLEPR